MSIQAHKNILCKTDLPTHTQTSNVCCLDLFVQLRILPIEHK